MASRIVAVARQSTAISQFSSTSRQPSHFLQRRGLAGSADHHGPAKINCWADPMSPSMWKEEHFVIVSLTGWGLAIFGGYKLFSGGKGKEEKVVQNLQ